MLNLGSARRDRGAKPFSAPGDKRLQRVWVSQLVWSKPASDARGYMDAKSGRRLAFAIVASNSVFSSVEGAFAANDDVGKVATIIQQSY